MKKGDRSTITFAKRSIIIVHTAVTLSFLFPNRILVLFGYPCLFWPGSRKAGFIPNQRAELV